MTIPNGANLNQLNQMLWEGSPTVAGAAAEQLIAINQAPVIGGTIPDWRITVYDKFWKQIGLVGDYIECTGMDARNKLPTATIKIKGDDPNVPVFFNCQNTMVGVTIETEGVRFAFYVDTFDYEYKNGAWVGTVNLLGIYDILNYLQIWPDWFLPIQAQILSYAIVLGPIVSSIEILIMEQALRIQTGLNEFINNALSLDPDVAAWFGSLLTYHGNIYEMLSCPVVVTLTNPLMDTSVLVCRTIRMESCGKVIEDITRSTGIDVTVDLWLPGDPQPANVWITLQLPTYVVSVVDRSQITGPTGTIIDSILKTVVDLSGSILGDIVAPLIEGFQEVKGLPQGFYISPGLGINWLPPWVLLIAPESGQAGSVDTCKITAHTPKGWQQIIGGRSPQWVGAPPGKTGGAPAPGPKNDSTILLTYFSSGLSTQSQSWWVSPESPTTCFQASSTTPSSHSSSGNPTNGAAQSAPTTRASKFSTPPHLPPTTSKQSSVSSTHSGTAADGYAFKPAAATAKTTH